MQSAIVLWGFALALAAIFGLLWWIIVDGNELHPADEHATRFDEIGTFATQLVDPADWDHV